MAISNTGAGLLIYLAQLLVSMCYHLGYFLASIIANMMGFGGSQQDLPTFWREQNKNSESSQVFKQTRLAQNAENWHRN